MANYERYEQTARNIFRGTALLLVGELALSWLASDVAAKAFEPSPAVYIDCAKQPDGSARAQFDALRPQELFMGDVQTDAAGRPEKWRTLFVVDTYFHDAGQIGVEVQGSGPVLDYGDLPKNVVATPINALIAPVDNGHLLNVSQAPHPPGSAHEPVVATFNCGPADK